MNNKVALTIGAVLIAVGLFKPDLSNFIPHRGGDTVVTPVSAPPEPVDPELKEKALELSKLITVNDASVDGMNLSRLWGDLAGLIEMDSDNEVIKTTAEIREANSVSGRLMNLKLQGKYPGLTEAAREIVVDSIGMNNVVINEETRAKAIDAFRALSWAAYMGAK